MLEPLYQQQIELCLIEAGQQLAKIGFGQFRFAVRCFSNAGMTTAGGNHHLLGTRLAQAVAVFARLVDIKVVVGVLEHPDAQAAIHQQGDQLLQQGGLAGAAPGGEAEQGKGGCRGHEVTPCWGSIAVASRRAS